MHSFFYEKWKQVQNWLKAEQKLEQPVCQILCIDDDRSFCQFLQQLAYSLGIQVDAVNSIQEAKEAIEKDVLKYKAFIIDGYLPDGSGFELIAWIRKKRELRVPIGFISRIYQDASSFRLLKENLQVDYVLEKPIRPSEVHQLLILMSHLTSQQVIIPEIFSHVLLTDLAINYEKTIPDKVERLETLILNVQKHPSIENLQALKGEVHKIAGSAGSYGYIAVSDICKNLEADLINEIDFAKQGQFDDQWIASLDDVFTRIKFHFQINIPERESIHKPRVFPSVYIVDEDQTFLDAFIRSSKDLNVGILTESHPNQAIQTLLTADIYPQIILIHAHYSQSSLTGYELIKGFYRGNSALTSKIALMVEEQALETQAEAFQKGRHIVIAKSFSPSLILPLLDQIPFPPFPLRYKVLVIDEDEDMCQYILKSLRFSGLEIKALHDFFDLEGVVKIYQPDLILLDANLADASGIGILDRLRNEWGYENLILGMVAFSQQETDVLQKCYEANVDGILFKPLEEGILQRKIADVLSKKTKERLSITRDPKIGLEHVQTFKHYLKELLGQFQESVPQMLVIFEIEEFKTLSSQAKEETIADISQALEDLLKTYEMAAHLEEGRFALIFQGYHPHFVQLFMRHFLRNVHSHLQGKKVNSPINEALVILSGKEDSSQILQRGYELLHLARQQSSQSVRLVTDSSVVPSKEVFIFHDEAQSIDFLKNLFQQNGFQVFSMTSFKESFQKYGDLSLLILTGSFAEAKGLHVLTARMMQTSMQFPILYLSHLPEVEYVQALLNKVDYFESPFHLAMIFPVS